MINTIKNTYRLTKAGATLAWHGVGFVPELVTLPGPLRVLRGSGDDVPVAKRKKKASASPKQFGSWPTYIKLGQFLATRPDVVGPQLANALGSLRDRLPPFSIQEAHREIEAAFGRPWNEIYEDFGPPIAAASIAQVHKATVRTPTGPRAVAVKILRPHIEKRFERDLESFYFAAHAAERFSPQTRRLRPVAAVDAGAVGGAGDGPAPRSSGHLGDRREHRRKGAMSGSGCPTWIGNAPESAS